MATLLNSHRSSLRESDTGEARLLNAIESRTARCAVIGLGYIGTTAMQALLAAGFEVHGYDRSPEAVARFRSRMIECKPDQPWSVGTDAAILERADMVWITVRILVRSEQAIDLEPLKAAARSLNAAPRRERLILVGSTLPPGTTRRFATEWLSFCDEFPVFVAHCPERLQVDNPVWTFRNIPHLVAGVTSAATRLANRFFSTICDHVIPVSSPEVSELSKLLENAFLAVGIGLAGEITRIAHAFGISASEVTAAAASKPFGYHAFHPGPGIGGHCIPNDLQILRRTSRELGLGSPLLDGTARVATDLPVAVVDRLEHLLSQEGLKLNGATVLLVGVGFKIGSADTTESPAGGIVRCLRSRSYIPMYLDSCVPSFTVDGQAVLRVEHEALTQDRFCAGLILAGDAAANCHTLEDAVRVLLDTGGGRIMAGGFSKAHRL